MQRSTTTEATFITTSAGQRAIRTVASFVAVALVGTTPWMVSNSTLAQDAPATEPAPAPAPAQDDAAAKAAAEQAAAEAAAAEAAAAEAAAVKAAQVEAARTAAREALGRSEWKKAIDLWSAVLSAVPGDAEAAKALARAQAALDQGSLINEVGTDIALRKQRAQVEVASAVMGANKSIENGDFASAERQALEAKARLARYEGDFAAGEFKSLMGQLDSAFELARQGSMNADLQRRIQSDAEAAKSASERKQSEAAARAKAINDRLDRVRRLQLELKYDEAIQVVDEILFLDPNNVAAQTLRQAFKASKLYRDYSAIEVRRGEAYANFSKEALDRTVPPTPNVTGPGPKSVSSLLEYPEDWPALSEMRLRNRASGYSETPANRQAMAALGKAYSFQFDGNQLDAVFNYMRDVSKVDFYPDWKALEGMGIRPDDTITVALENVPTEVALKRVMEQLGDESERPDYAVEDGVVVISSPDQLRKKTLTIVYDIRDLLFEVPYFDNAPDFNLGSALQQGGQLAQAAGHLLG